MPTSICRGCDEVFTGVGPFDLHQKETARHPFTRCLPPHDVGLRKNDLGRWGGDGEPSFEKISYIPAAERPAHEYEVECRDCGTIFMRPRTRGRPPKRCDDCKEAK